MKKGIKIILVIIGMLVIFNFSNQGATESNDLTSKIITKVLTTTNNIFNMNLNKTQVKKLIKKVFVPVRKCAHFTIYFILALLLINLLKEYNISFRKKIIISLLICFVYACSDEFHQMFVPGRTAANRDVFIDTLGAELSLFIYIILKKLKKDN